jgi:predicted AAA+ superfamily ATPase
VRQYLEGIINTVLLKDVASARKISSVDHIRAVAEFLFSSIGSLTSTNRIANTMTSAGRKISRPTVDSIMTGLIDSHLILPARRWDIRGKRLLEGGGKHYVVDVGMRRALLGTRPVDAGHILENTVFLELCRRPGLVYSGKIGTREVDFVVEDGNGTHFIQVAYSVEDPATLERELASLRAVRDATSRILLTADREPPQVYDGIRRLSVFDWLLAGGYATV